MTTDPQGSPVLREIDDYPKEDDRILLRRSLALSFVAPTPTTDPQGSPLLKRILLGFRNASSFVAPTPAMDPTGGPLLREVKE
jgi:hypothetical protein